MPAPTPPVELKNQCSVIFNNTLYVYSPDAFQSIELKEDAEWEEHNNGVAVTGAQCVLGGVDGDNQKRALYVIGGTANATNDNFAGFQRFTFNDQKWTTIDPLVEVTKNRVRHGANYIPSTNSIVLYGGTTVPGYDGLSSETFAIALEEPYAVEAYDSKDAPPTSKPFVMPWGDDSVVMVGGSSTNTKVFTFTTGGGWVPFGVDLPNPLPDASVAQAAMFTLQDGSKILQTFQLGQDPIGVSTNVLLNPGAVPGTFGQTAGGPAPSTNSQTPPPARAKRQFLSNYPAYNSSSVPDATRSDFSLAQGSDGLVAFVGGDDDSSVTFYNQAENSWVSAQALLGEAQQTLRPSTSSATPTSSTSPTATASETPAAAGNNDSGNNSKTFEILGGVLGGICGLVAILIILLLYLRHKKRKQRRETAQGHKSYPPGKKASTDFDFEDGLHPLRDHGQPMGRSPVNSQILDRSSTAMFTSRPTDNLIRRISSDNRLQPETSQQKSTSAAYSIFAKERSPLAKSPLAISKPTNPYLGDYGDRPSIDLGKATPATPVNATPHAGAIPSRSKSNRKTDEAWGRYFSGERVDPTAEYPAARPVTRARGNSGGGGSGFWPGAGVPVDPPKSPKFAFRDSMGNTLQTRSVGTASPALENGPSGQYKRYLSAAQPKAGRISNANSLSSDGSEYEDDAVDPAFSSGIPASVQDDTPWNSPGNTWSGPAQRPLRGANDRNPSSAALTTSSGEESHATGSSGGIPNFPMPQMGRGAAKPMISQVQHPAASHARSGSRSQQQDGYFPPVGGHKRGPSINTDVSWLNLGNGPNRR